ncbi:carbonic anhydrase family protein [Brumimicrobium mesophilum]|uniref:carbonic anhydrase family protein n=1 Tax=Brumimicrobium mesophilum TaxID=392717 RepID=UPI000D141832|nr:carbonic anhydrase family protein [Brumimicrobium mesophilum]
MNTINKEIQTKLSIEEIKQILKDGNERFVKNTTMNRDLLSQVRETSTGQFPHTVVLGCIDSRVTSEQVFDLGIGDSFNTRIAGNIVNDDILGSLEYSCKVAGAKLILVLGHTRCGAVTSACQGVELGNITGLLSKIKVSVDKVRSNVEDVTENESVNLVVNENVLNSMNEIRNGSEIILEMEKNNEVAIIGGVYDVENGVVTFLD